MYHATDQDITQASTDGIQALIENPQKNVAYVYPEGFLPNAYRWPAPGTRIVVVRVGMGKFITLEEGYDRKRSYGKGSYITLWRDRYYSQYIR